MQFILKLQDTIEKKNREGNAKFCWHSKEPKLDNLSISLAQNCENPKWRCGFHFHNPKKNPIYSQTHEAIEKKIKRIKQNSIDTQKNPNLRVYKYSNFKSVKIHSEGMDAFL